MNKERIVAGLDVHKDTIYLCIMAHDEAIIFEKIYGTLICDLKVLRDDLALRGVKEVAMESTAVYWIPVWNTLDGKFELKLVNPYFIKQLPGRKSDVKDAQWIAECLLKNLIRGSFVPNATVQDMRKYNRRIFDLQRDITYNTNKLDAAMQRCGFRLSNYVSRVNSVSYQNVVRAIAGGETDPDKLARKVHGRIRNHYGPRAIRAAVEGVFHQADIDLIRQLQETIDMCETHARECQQRLTAMCKENFPEEYARIQTVPGVKERAATAVIAEVGVDMKMFATAAALVGWCGLKPRNDVSNGHYKSRRITHGNKYLRQILIEIAWVASRKKGCFFNNFSFIHTTVRHKSKMKVQVAIARKILVAIWHMLKKKEDFVDVYIEQQLKDTATDHDHSGTLESA